MRALSWINRAIGRHLSRSKLLAQTYLDKGLELVSNYSLGV